MFVNIFLFVIGGVIKDYKLYALLFLTFANLYILTKMSTFSLHRLGWLMVRT
jgi:hypothetical protein